MNKARFTNLALEVAREMRCEFPADEWDNSGEEHSEESYTFYKRELIEFATKFLARVRAEEGKGAVGYLDDDFGFNFPGFFSNQEELLRKGILTPLFLHTQEKQWNEGYPQNPWDKEWFIARIKGGGRAVLTALPEEYTYDFKTFDETYFKKERIKCWMQFPDSEFISPREPKEGYVLVPIEPTETVIDALRENGAEGTRDALASDYKAMIQAAKEEAK